MSRRVAGVATRARAGRHPRGAAAWRGGCGSYQGEVAPLIYGAGGAAAVVHRCFPSSWEAPRLRFFAVVREPLARALSSIAFWGRKHEKRAEFDAIAPEAVTAADVAAADRAAMALADMGAWVLQYMSTR